MRKKKQVSKELRNAEKRRQRLKKRAKQLSHADLVAVMSLRTAERAMARTLATEDSQVEDEPDDSEDGSATSASTRGVASASASPMQPSKKSKSA